MRLLLRNIDRWLFEEYRTSAEDLALYRIFFAGYVLLNALPMGLWRLPQAAYSPTYSLAALFTDFPGHAAMVALNALALLCACCVLIGYRTALASVGLALSIVTVDSFAFADGKVDEGLVIWIALILAGSGWGSALSVDARSPRDESALRRHAWLLAILALLVGLALLTAGAAKAKGGWLGLGTLGTRYHLFWNYFVYERPTLAARWAWEHMPASLWKAGDVVTVLWEMGFCLACFRRSWCRVACAIGALFHLGVWMLFDIRVADNVLAYGAFFGWAAAAAACPEGVRARLRALSPAQLRVVRALPFGYALSVLLLPQLRGFVAPLVSKAVLATGALVALLYLAARAKQLLRKPALAQAGSE